MQTKRIQRSVLFVVSRFIILELIADEWQYSDGETRCFRALQILCTKPVQQNKVLMSDVVKTETSVKIFAYTVSKNLNKFILVDQDCGEL